MGLLEAVCISARKGEVKHPVTEIVLKAGWGIAGDAHAGERHRQVSLLPGESIDRMKKILPTIEQGAYAENMIIRGVDVMAVAVGDRIKVGEALLEITQVGKECHRGCAIRKQTGDCIMPGEGLFARVLYGGTARPGDAVEHLPAAEKIDQPGQESVSC